MKFLRNPFTIMAGLALIMIGTKIIWNLPGPFLEVSFIILFCLLVILAVIGQVRESRRIIVESELRRAENEKSIILDSILDVVVYFDPDYKIIWQSKNAASSGLNHQFRHTSQCCRTWEGQTLACEGCAIHQSMARRKPGEGEIHSEDGKTWWIRTYPVFNSQHEFTGMIEFSSDITKIKQAENLVRRYNEELEQTVMDRTRELNELNLLLQEEIDERNSFENALLQSKNKFSSVITHSPYGIYLTDTEGIVVEWNGAMEEITGIYKKDALGSYVWDVYLKLMPESEFSQMNQLAYKLEFKELLTAGSTDSSPSSKGQNIIIVTPGRKIKTVHTHRFTIKADKGFKVAAHVRDVTHELIREAAIRDREAKLSTIFDNTYQGFILLDLEGRVLEMNHQGKKYLRLYNSRIQRYDFLESALPEDYKEIFHKLFTLVLKEKTLRTQVKLPFTRYISRWFDIRLTVVQKDDDNSGIFINAIDINEQTKADQEMRKALEMEKDLNRLRAQFVSSVSHEFRTPLASIYSNSQLLKRYDSKWDETKKEQTFERIFSSVHHMTSLLQDVSLLGKGQSGMYKFQPDKTEIITFCHQVKQEVLSSSDLNPIIEFETNISHLEVSVDINLVRHILVNLLNNACKYSDPDTRVFFGLTDQDQKLHFEIKDQGIGIPEEDLPHIFDPFYRAGNVGKIQGSGLGMAVVKQCVDIHNGKIFIESKRGEGTTVNVLLPYTNIS